VEQRFSAALKVLDKIHATHGRSSQFARELLSPAVNVWGRVRDPSRRSKAPQLAGKTHRQGYDYALLFHRHPEEAQVFAKRRPASEEPAPSLPRGSLHFYPKAPVRHDATGEGRCGRD